MVILFFNQTRFHARPSSDTLNPSSDFKKILEFRFIS